MQIRYFETEFKLGNKRGKPSEMGKQLPKKEFQIKLECNTLLCNIQWMKCDTTHHSKKINKLKLFILFIPSSLWLCNSRFRITPLTPQGNAPGCCVLFAVYEGQRFTFVDSVNDWRWCQNGHQKKPTDSCRQRLASKRHEKANGCRFENGDGKFAQTGVGTNNSVGGANDMGVASSLLATKTVPRAYSKVG